jgi:hypothetical protein
MIIVNKKFYIYIHMKNLNIFFRVSATIIGVNTDHIHCDIHKRMVRFQKYIRNLFLNLHGHNIHRQRRQLSTFLMH